MRFQTLLIVLVLITSNTLLAQPIPTTAIDLTPNDEGSSPATRLIGESSRILITFDNTGAPGDVGYGPFIDLVLPVGGIDGVDASQIQDGITFLAAEHLNVPIEPLVRTFPPRAEGETTPSSCISHPIAKDEGSNPVQVCGTPGDQLLVFKLPFGSFTAEAPPVTLGIELHLSSFADLASPLPLRSRGGFLFGADSLDNPCCDPVLFSSPSEDSSTWTDTAEVEPVLFELSQTYLGPEDETATGPDFEQSYRLEINVADGQTLTNLELVDLLPPELAYLRVENIGGGGVVIDEPSIGSPTLDPDHDLRVNFPSLTGTSGPAEGTVTWSFFVDRTSAVGAPVLSPSTGDDALSINSMEASCDWQPLDSRDPVFEGASRITTIGPDHSLSDQSVAVQKTVSIVTDNGVVGPTPGDILEYRLELQISDFFAFQNVEISDLLSDGQRFDTSFTPTFEFGEHGVSSSGSMDPSNVEVLPNYTPADAAPNDGTTTLRLLLSDELQLRRGTGRVLGGCVPTAGIQIADCDSFHAGGTTGVVLYRTVIQEVFSDNFPSGDASVDQGDVLTNSVEISGDVLTLSDFQPTGFSELDDSSASIALPFGSVQKLVYAVDGNTTLPDPFEIFPGQTITWRIQLNLPHLDFEDLRLDDYLPLPILDADEVTNFLDLIDGTAPAAGTAKFGPNESLRTVSGLLPVLTIDSSANLVSFDFGDHDDTEQRSATIDILFTVTVSSDPFADELPLTNRVRHNQGSTNGEGTIGDAIAQITLREPHLKLSKGIVASSNLSSTLQPADPGAYLVPTSSATLESRPVESNLVAGDAGDRLSFVLVVENLGGGGAFDIILKDTLPSGLGVPASGPNLTAALGDGTQIEFLGKEGGGATDLFGPGLELIDPNGVAVCQPYDPDRGDNLVIVSYELEITQPDALPGALLENLAAVPQYAGADGAGAFANHAEQPLEALASVELTQPEIAKAILATSETATAEADPLRPVLIGETVTYQVVITVPEGTQPNAIMTDVLDPGLTFVSLDALTPSAGLETDRPGSFADVLASASVAGTNLSLDFGTLSNTNQDDETSETLSLTYTARVSNVAANLAGQELGNQAAWTWSTGSLSTEAPPVLVQEPSLALSKVAQPSVADAGDTVTYTIEVTHDNTSSADAFDLTIEDLLSDPDLQLVAGSVTAEGGLVSLGNTPGDTDVRVHFDHLPIGETRTILLSAQISNAVLSGDAVENTASLAFDSLPADESADERNYGPIEATGIIQIDIPSVAKSVVGTSETTSGSARGDAGLSDLTIGETVTYELLASIPEGVTSQVILRDTLPASAQGVLAFVSGELIELGSSLTATIPNPVPTSQDNNLNDGLPDTVIFDFGQVSNTPDGARNAGDEIRLRLTAQLVDRTANTSGDTLANTALIDFGGALQPTGQAWIDVVEPLLQVDASCSISTGDAADPIDFTIRVEHRGDSTADAFDVRVTDALPTGFVLIEDSIVDLGDAPADFLTDAGGEIAAGWQHLPVGAVGLVRFSVRVAHDVEPGQSITLPVDLTWTSLPDTVSEERTGSDYEGHLFTVTEPGVAKSITTTSEPSTGTSLQGPETDLTLGEQVTYEITVTLPEGHVQNAQVIDQLPQGSTVLGHISSRLLSVGSNLSGNALPAIGQAAQVTDGDGDQILDRLQWTLGTIQNLPDGQVDGRDQLRFEVVAVVLDLPSNQGGADDFANTATFQHDGGQSIGIALADLVEPELSLTKSTPTTFFDAGDTVLIELVIEHTGTSSADAFSLEIADQISEGLSWMSGGTVASDCTGFSFDDSDPTLPIFSASALVDGESCTISYQATVDADVEPGQSLVHPASLTYDSTPVFVSGATRQKETSTSLEMSIVAPALVKVATSTSLDATQRPYHRQANFDLAIGELVDYELTVIFPEGQTREAVVTDLLPVGWDGTLEAVGASIIAVGANLTTSLPGIPTLIDDRLGDGRADTVRFNFGTVQNAADGEDTEADRIVLNVTAQVINDIGNWNGRQVVNHASFSFANHAPLTDTASIDIVEPELELSKSMGPVEGRIVTITLELRNTGTGPAFDLEIEDDLPAAVWQGESTTFSHLPDGFLASLEDSASGTTVKIISDQAAATPAFLLPGTSRRFVFRTPLSENAGIEVNNSALNTAASSLPGTDPEERFEPEKEASANLGLPNLRAERQTTLWVDADGSGTTSPGDTVRITVEVINDGQGDANDVSATDSAFEFSNLVIGSVQVPSGSVLSGNQAGDTSVEILLPTVPAGSSASFQFDVQIVPSLPVDVEQVTCQGALDSRELLPFLTDDPQIPGEQDPNLHPLAAEPRFVLTKDDGGQQASWGGQISYTLSVSNQGNQDAQGVVLQETVPTHTQFDAANSSAGWSCADGAPADSTCTFNVGELAVGASTGATFAVRVSTSLPIDVNLLSNTASVADDGSQSPQPVTASATDTTPVDNILFSKTRIDEQATIGEEAAFRIRIVVPEGASIDDVRLLDPLPNTLLGLRADSVQASSNISWTSPDQPLVDADGLDWTLGTLSNTDTDLATEEAIEVVLVTRIANTATNQQGTNPLNSATLSASGHSLNDDADVALVEPQLVVETDFDPVFAIVGDTVKVRLRVYHPASSGATAYDVEIFDTLDPLLTYVGNLQVTNGPAPSLQVDGGQITLSFAEIDRSYNLGHPVELTFEVSVDADPVSAEITNLAELTWTSQPGLIETLPGYDGSVERTGSTQDPGGALNDYQSQDEAQLVSRLIYAFEDLDNDPNQHNDFDYNDWVLAVELDETYNELGQWTHLEIYAEALARGAGFRHIPYMDVGIEGRSTVRVERFDRDGTLLSVENRQVNNNFIHSLQLFQNSWEALPPAQKPNYPFAANTDQAQTEVETTLGQYTRITIDVLDPHLNPRVIDDPQTAHLNETYNQLIGPWINVIDTGNDIYHRWRHRSATQDLVSGNLYGFSTPLLGFPLDQATNYPGHWEWPIERIPMWEAYPEFVNHTFSGGTSHQRWFDSPQADRVWPVGPASTAPAERVNEDPVLPSGSFAFAHTFSSPLTSSPAVGDLDGDGSLEVVVGAFLSQIAIHNADGSLDRLIDPVPDQTPQSAASVTLANLDGDQDLEILRGYDNGKIYAFHHDGTLFGSIDVGDATLKSTLAVGDPKGDGSPAIFVLGGDTKLYGFDTSGQSLTGFPVTVGGTADISNDFVILPSPTLHDLDGDQVLDILVASNDGKVHAYSATGEALTGWPYDSGQRVLSSLAVADLDGLGGAEVVLATDIGGVLVLSSSGSLLWSVNRTLGGPSSPAIGDLDGDGDQEIVVGSFDGKLYAWHHDGSTVTGWPVTSQSAVQASPTLVDTDGDGASEVFVGSFDTDLYALKGDGSALKASSGDSFPIHLPAVIFSSPAIADLDGDGRPEAITGCHDRRLYAVEIQGEVEPGSVLWSQFRGNAGHSGTSEIGPIPASADLGLSLDNGLTEVAAGTVATYHLNLANAGPNDAADLTLQTSLPVSLLDTSWSCSANGAICPADLASSFDLPSGAELDFTLSGFVAHAAVGTLTVSASIATNGDVEDPHMGNNTALDSDPILSDTTPPSILATSPIVACGTHRQTIEEIELSFSESLGQAASLGSFLLLEAGTDRDLSSVDCSGATGDDIAVEMAGLEWGGILEAVTLHPGAPLTTGRYRLLVCSDLSDRAGLPLDGNGDGLGGDAFKLDFRVDLENLFDNGTFDCDLEGWLATSALPEEIAHAELDVDEAATSGTASVVRFAQGEVFTLGQCVSLEGLSSLQWSGYLRLDIDPEETLSLFYGCEFHADSNCLDAPLDEDFSSGPQGSTGGDWKAFNRQLSVPSGSSSALCRVGFADDQNRSFEGLFDALRLEEAATLFETDFEAGDLSVWTSVRP